jgi:hypothetical protein
MLVFMIVFKSLAEELARLFFYRSKREGVCITKQRRHQGILACRKMIIDRRYTECGDDGQPGRRHSGPSFLALLTTGDATAIHRLGGSGAEQGFQKLRRKAVWLQPPLVIFGADDDGHPIMHGGDHEVWFGGEMVKVSTIC